MKATAADSADACATHRSTRCCRHVVTTPRHAPHESPPAIEGACAAPRRRTRCRETPDLRTRCPHALPTPSAMAISRCVRKEMLKDMQKQRQPAPYDVTATPPSRPQLYSPKNKNGYPIDCCLPTRLYHADIRHASPSPRYAARHPDAVFDEEQSQSVTTATFDRDPASPSISIIHQPEMPLIAQTLFSAQRPRIRHRVLPLRPRRCRDLRCAR